MKFTEKYNDKTYILSQDKRQTVSLKDHGESRKYVGRNPGKLELSVFRVDNGICKSSKPGDQKCDYAIYTGNDNLYLIELKGADYSKAIDQLNCTVKELLSEDIEGLKAVFARVVLSKTNVPQTLKTKEKKLMMLLKKKYKGSLLKKTKEMTEDLV
ncbi:MAG TPA: hypothetical protein H9977_10795 [Candidatus Parabacteroides intestinipullorum]|uniref:Uncharacterized protein n=1 Tax=Candidatus Parabacteroides intestinipullorum TaxID=2838723 RepID=A0A9D1X9P5_9BACT|nr:hypothetical protein [Candidatus Parabacteroides intestinipullorum]